MNVRVVVKSKMGAMIKRLKLRAGCLKKSRKLTGGAHGTEILRSFHSIVLLSNSDF